MRVGRDEAITGCPRRLRNAAAVCASGRLAGVYHKRRLPNYGVFDEERWFAPGSGDLFAFEVAGVTVGSRSARTSGFPAVRSPISAPDGAQLVVNLNASPYSVGRRSERLDVLAERVAEAGCAIAT